jgi:hypothetical protein
MSFYAEMAATAAELIAEFGATGEITERATGTYDPATGRAPVVETAHQVVIAIFDMPERRIDGTRILTGDKSILLSTKKPDGTALAITPKPDMKLTDAAGTVYTVINVKPLAPALTAVLWELQARK